MAIYNTRHLSPQQVRPNEAGASTWTPADEAELDAAFQLAKARAPEKRPKTCADRSRNISKKACKLRSQRRQQSTRRRQVRRSDASAWKTLRVSALETAVATPAAGTPMRPKLRCRGDQEQDKAWACRCLNPVMQPQPRKPARQAFAPSGSQSHERIPAQAAHRAGLVYTHTHTHTNTQIHTETNTQSQTEIHTQSHTHTQTHTNTNRVPHKHAQTHTPQLERHTGKNKRALPHVRAPKKPTWLHRRAKPLRPRSHCGQECSCGPWSRQGSSAATKHQAPESCPRTPSPAPAAR